MKLFSIKIIVPVLFFFLGVHLNPSMVMARGKYQKTEVKKEKKDKSESENEESAGEENVSEESTSQKGASSKAVPFGTSPPSIYLETTGGQKISTSITIDNPSDSAEKFTIEPFGVKVSGYPDLHFVPIRTLPSNHLSRHINVDQKVVTVPAKSRKQVNIFIDVPKGLEGTQYTGVGVTRLTAQLPDIKRIDEYSREVGVGMQPGLNTIIKVNIQGTLNYGLQVGSVEIIPSQGNKPLSAKVQVNNTGNAEIAIAPVLVLMDKNNQVKARLKSQSMVTVLPASSNVIKFQPAFSTVPPGTYTAVFTPSAKQYTFPPYEVKVSVVK